MEGDNVMVRPVSGNWKTEMLYQFLISNVAIATEGVSIQKVGKNLKAIAITMNCTSFAGSVS